MGSIQKRSTDDGQARWKARYRGPDRRERAKTFVRKVDAQRWLTAQEADLSRATWVDPALGTVPLEVWAEQWLDHRHDLKPKTVHGYQSLLRSRIGPVFERVPIGKIEPWHVRAWVAEMVDDGLSPSRVRQSVRLLSQILAAAVADRRIPSNPCVGAKLPRLPRTEMRFLTAEQVMSVAVAADSLDGASGADGLLILALGYGGFRWGEAIALTRRRLDLLRARVHVVEAVATVGADLHLGPTKTYQSRWVTVPAQVRDRLAGHLKALDGDLVWSDSRGGLLRHSNWHRRVWLKSTEAAKLKGVRIHDLRHTCAALLIGQGVHPLAVSRHLGHASIAITMDRYGHLFPETDELVGRALTAAFDGDVVELSRPPRGLGGRAPQEPAQRHGLGVCETARGHGMPRH